MEHKKPFILYAEQVGKQDFRDIPWQINMDGTASGMNSFYSAHWVAPKEPETEESGKRKVGHPPHMHKENEIIMLIGADYENPYDLGGTVEFCFGENMEKYVFDRSCTIMIPAGTPHGFFHMKEVHRPFLFVSVQEGSPRTEKFLWEYLSKEEMESIEHPEKWIDRGFEENEN